MKRRTKKIYEVTYDGLWLGGVALVKAFDKEDAIAKVEADPRTIDFTKVHATEIKGDLLYNNNGNY